MTGRALAALVGALVLGSAPAAATDWNLNQFEIPSGSETLRFKPNPASGDLPLDANLCAVTVSGLVCEGASADAFEGRLAMPEATGVDSLWSLPAGGGVLLAGPLTDAQIPNDITVDQAALAAALVADPVDCPPGQYAAVINEVGDLACGQVQFSEVAGVPARTACVAIDNVTSTTLRPFWIAPDSGATISMWRCNYFDTCGTPPTVEIEDQTATILGVGSLACVNGTVGGAWSTVPSPNTLSGREILYVDVTNSPTATCDILLCVQYAG